MRIDSEEPITWKEIKTDEGWFVYAFFLENQYLEVNRRRHRAKEKILKRIRADIAKEGKLDTNGKNKKS